MDQSEYRVAQICLNGHTINEYADTSPERNEQFCRKCGSKTINKCQHCNTSIRGKYMTPGFIVATSYIPPKFCPSCGQAYPWTDAKIKAAESLADLIEDISVEERVELKESIRNIVRDTPQTLLAAYKFQKIIAKSGPIMKDAIWETIADVANDKATKIINF